MTPIKKENGRTYRYCPQCGELRQGKDFKGSNNNIVCYHCDIKNKDEKLKAKFYKEEVEARVKQLKERDRKQKESQRRSYLRAKGELPPAKDRQHLVTYNGETRNIAEWAKLLGMKCSTLRGRIVTNGWSVDRAFNEPVGAQWRGNNPLLVRTKAQAKRWVYKGEALTTGEWAKRVGLSVSLLDARLNRHGWSIERALETPYRSPKQAYEWTAPQLAAGREKCASYRMNRAIHEERKRAART